jgi:peptide/nickel transport system substrate-binding protein
MGARTVCTALVLIAAAGLASAQTLRWSNNGNYLTTDPHAQNTVITNQINTQVNERLLRRGKKLEILPGLVSSWERTSPTVWVFKLRKGVKWSDGTDFTADDVVFSVQRAQGPTSGFRLYATMLGTPRKVDSHTVEFTTAVPNPVMLDTAAQIAVMSKAWSEKHHVEKAQDYSRREETYAARNMMGTGPFVLVSHEPDVKTAFKKNPNWWGIKEGLFEGNLTDVVFIPLSSDPTRMSALASGEIDFVLDPPTQDIERLRKDKSLRIYQGPENTMVFIGMDQQRDELLHSNVKGKNPFKDVRVRRAIYHAIDMDAIAKTALRGFAVPTGIPLSNPEGAGIPKSMDNRLPTDIVLARKLLGEAGYPAGFTVTMDCDVRNERVCAAMAAMLAKVGITLNLSVAAPALFYQKIRKLDTSMYLMGWVSAIDSIFMLQPVIHSRNDKGDGEWNFGGFKDEKLDAAIDAARIELDEAKRHALILEATTIAKDGVYIIPLYRRMAPWVSRANVEVVHRPDTWLETTWVRVR